MTFLISPPFDPARKIMTNLQLSTLRAKAFEKAYCALISSPCFGDLRKGGSIRSTRNPCTIEFTTRATSTSSGSFIFPGTYTGTGFCSRLGVNTPLRDGGRKREDVVGVAVPDVSRKLDGGPFDNIGRERPALVD